MTLAPERESPPSRIASPLDTVDRVRVLVVDDHPMVRKGIAHALALERRIAVVAEAGNGREAIAAYAEQRPDVVLLDLSLPDFDGVAATERIRTTHPDARIVIFTSYVSEEDVAQAVDAGVRGYALKDMQPDELHRCILAVASGRPYFSSAVATALATRLHDDSLSARERDVLAYLGRGLSNKAIARLAGITEGTVKTHVKSVLSKLRARTRSEAILVGIRKGLIKVR